MYGGRNFWTTAAEYVGYGRAAAATAADDTDADSEENTGGGGGGGERMGQGFEEEKTSKTRGVHVTFKGVPGDDVKEEGGGEP